MSEYERSGRFGLRLLIPSFGVNAKFWRNSFCIVGPFSTVALTMGKKTKGKSTPHLVEAPTIESLLDVIISEYIQVCTVPSGKLLRGPYITTEGHESIDLAALCHYERGCPQNLFDFVATSGNKSISPETAYSWWARSRLRYSCSTIVVSFVRFFVAHLKTEGVHELSFSSGQTLRLADLEVFTLFFGCPKRHRLVLSSFMKRTEFVEMAINDDNDPPICTHNMLKCSRTGIIIDITIGQFLGTVKPYVFKDTGEYFSHVPGKVVSFHKTPKEDVDAQVARDSDVLHVSLSPDTKPERFVKRVLRSLWQKKEFCSNCKGVASPTATLRRCMRCKRAMYCGKACQILHWRSGHKHTCGQ